MHDATSVFRELIIDDVFFFKGTMSQITHLENFSLNFSSLQSISCQSSSIALIIFSSRFIVTSWLFFYLVCLFVCLFLYATRGAKGVHNATLVNY